SRVPRARASRSLEAWSRWEGEGLVGVAGVAGTVERQSTGEAIDPFTHGLQLVLDIAQQAAVFGDLSGEVFVFDAHDVGRLAWRHSTFGAPAFAAPSLYAHATRRAHDARLRIG